MYTILVKKYFHASKPQISTASALTIAKIEGSETLAVAAGSGLNGSSFQSRECLDRWDLLAVRWFLDFEEEGPLNNRNLPNIFCDFAPRRDRIRHQGILISGL
jgi:hypothetical protein